MAIDENNPQTEYFNSYSISYFKGNTGIGKNDDWDYCSFIVWARHGPIHYNVKDKKHVEDLRSLLERVYDIGKHQAKEEIRRVLGVKE